MDQGTAHGHAHKLGRMENIGPAFLDFLPALNQVPPRVDAHHPVLVPPRRFHFLEVEGLQGLIKCLVRRENFLLIGLERSEEHTSELQSRLHLVCRLLLEKKKNINKSSSYTILATST